MFFGKSKSKNMYCDLCTILNLVIGVFAALLSLAALVGVYMSHVLPSGLVFGTTSGSLSIMAFGLSLFLLKKAMAACVCQCEIPRKK